MTFGGVNIPPQRLSAVPPTVNGASTDHRGYVEAVTQATADLVRERFLREEDAERLVRTAEASNVLR